MAAGDVDVVGDVSIGEFRIVTGTVTLDGGNETPVDLSAYLDDIYGATVSIEGSAAPAADPNSVTSAFTPGTPTLNVYAWKVTTGGAAGNPTEVASTNNARLVNFIVMGSKAP